MAFIQIIEYTPTNPEEIEVLAREWQATTGSRRAQRGTLSQDRDRPDKYLQIVEFLS